MARFAIAAVHFSIFFVFFSMCANAANIKLNEFDYNCPLEMSFDGQPNTQSLNNVVRIGDHAKLIGAIRQAEDAGDVRYLTLCITGRSAGGDFVESLKIAQTLHLEITVGMISQ